MNKFGNRSGTGQLADWLFAGWTICGDIRSKCDRKLGLDNHLGPAEWTSLKFKWCSKIILRYALRHTNRNFVCVLSSEWC